MSTTPDTPVPIVTGTTSALQREMVNLQSASTDRKANDFLRERLEIYNWILVALFGFVFSISVYRLIDPLYGYNPIGALLANALALCLCGGIIGSLRRNPTMGSDGLRLVGWLTFIGIALFCMWFTIDKLFDNKSRVLSNFIDEHPVFAGCSFSFPWFALFLSYGTFVPNRWSTLALQAGILALGPILTFVGVSLIDPVLAGVFTGVFYLSVVAVLTCGVAGVVYGAYHVGRLRQDVIEARKVGPYRLGTKLGEGGMGVVYKAEHQLVKKPCAIKFIHADALRDPKQRQRFFREFQALARLSHWNLIEVYDFGETPDGTCYYVMEYLEGMALDQLVKVYGPLPPGRILYLMRQTAEALKMAHRLGLVHRDIKPSNIFLTQKGGSYDVVKVLDFGIVHDTKRTLGNETLTNVGAIVGTPGYMSPEQMAGHVDERSDLYSLGAVGYYLLTGQAPYTGSSIGEILGKQMTQEPPPLTELCPNAPLDLIAFIMRCLARRVEDRFATVEELLTAMDACAATNEWSAGQAEQWHLAQAVPQRQESTTLTLPPPMDRTMPTQG